MAIQVVRTPFFVFFFFLRVYIIREWVYETKSSQSLDYTVVVAWSLFTDLRRVRPVFSNEVVG